MPSNFTAEVYLEKRDESGVRLFHIALRYSNVSNSYVLCKESGTRGSVLRQYNDYMVYNHAEAWNHFSSTVAKKLQAGYEYIPGSITLNGLERPTPPTPQPSSSREEILSERNILLD